MRNAPIGYKSNCFWQSTLVIGIVFLGLVCKFIPSLITPIRWAPFDVLLTLHLQNHLCTCTKETILEPKFVPYNFCIRHPNAMLLGALEPPFKCQQENMKILTSIIKVIRSKKWWFRGYPT